MFIRNDWYIAAWRRDVRRAVLRATRLLGPKTISVSFRLSTLGEQHMYVR